MMEPKRTTHEFLAEISAAEGSSNSEAGLFSRVRRKAM
jgi:hypothetical protein